MPGRRRDSTGSLLNYRQRRRDSGDAVLSQTVVKWAIIKTLRQASFNNDYGVMLS